MNCRGNSVTPSLLNSKLRWGLILILCFLNRCVIAQTDSLAIKPNRKTITVASLGGLYVGSMSGLYTLWYKDYPQTKFHFINDNSEWLKMDKAGHVFSAYVEGKYGISMLKWAGYSDRKAAIYGPLYSLVYQTTIELFDGFSSGWGASGGDIFANCIGAGLVSGQALKWNEQRVTLKFSYSPTPFASTRPEIFGATPIQSIFKDYNGQTYWLCISPKLFAPKSKWPAWLDISLGYGVTGLYGGDDNIWLSKDPNPNFKDFSSTPRRMQFYLSPDINLEKLKIKKKWLKTTVKILNTFKFPLPALNYTTGAGLKFDPIKF